QDPDQGLGSRRADEDPALAVEHGIQALDFAFDDFWDLLSQDTNVGLCLRKTRHHGGRFLVVAAFERAAEKQADREPFSRHVVAQVDDVSGLLAAQETALTTMRLGHLTVA